MRPGNYAYLWLSAEVFGMHLEIVLIIKNGSSGFCLASVTSLALGVWLGFAAPGMNSILLSRTKVQLDSYWLPGKKSATIITFWGVLAGLAIDVVCRP